MLVNSSLQIPIETHWFVLRSEEKKKEREKGKKDKFLSTTAENGAESAFCEQKAGAERQDFDGRIGAETSVLEQIRVKTKGKQENKDKAKTNETCYRLGQVFCGEDERGRHETRRN